MLNHSNCRWALILFIIALSPLMVLTGRTQIPHPVEQLFANNNLTSQRQPTKQLDSSPNSPAPSDVLKRRDSPSNPLAGSRRFTFKGKDTSSSMVAHRKLNNGFCRSDPRAVNSSARGVSSPSVGLTALLPSNQFNGETISDRPTVLVYVPEALVYTPETATRQLIFLLRDSDENDVYQIRLNVTGSSQIVEIQLQKPLQVGKKYNWFAFLGCPGVPSYTFPFVEGWFQRVEPDNAFINQLNQVSLLDQASLYAKSGLWYEASMTLFNLRQSEPKNSEYIIAWTQLLKSVGLEKMAPVLPNP